MCAKFTTGASLIPGSQSTPLGNAIHKYVLGIWGGYGYESGIQSIQDDFLKQIPGHRSEGMLGENRIFSQKKVNTFVTENKKLIRK